MLTFEQKLAVIASYPELQRSDVSLGRVNFQYAESARERKNVVYHLHPNGNGYVYAGLLEGYPMDGKGLVNIRDFTEEELRELIEASVRSLSTPPAAAPAAAGTRGKRPPNEQRWTNPGKQTLVLKKEDDLWYVYAGLNLEMAFESYEEAADYLNEEGFEPAGGE